MRPLNSWCPALTVQVAVMALGRSGVSGTQCELSTTGTVGAQCNLHRSQGPRPHPTRVYLSAQAFASRHGSDLQVQAAAATAAPAAHCLTTASVASLGPAQGLSAKNFGTFTPSDPAHTWVNTPEGGWRAYRISSNEPPLGDLLLFPGMMQCRLATVAVHRLVQNETSLELEFHDCDVAVGVRRITLAIAVKQESGGKSRLVDWMCSLMDHSACWPAKQGATENVQGPSTTATTSTTTVSTVAVPHDVSMDLSADYTMLGSGPCESSDAEPAAQHELASTPGDCAVECLVRNRDVFIPGSSRKCEGFAFSKNDSPHCLVYKRINSHNANTKQATLLIGWTCYALGHVSGSTATGRVQGSSQTSDTFMGPSLSSEHTGLVPEHRSHTSFVGSQTNLVLDLSSELGSLPHHAVRQRLTPLQAGCFEPFDWISMISGVQITLNASAWNLIQSNLPLASVPSAELDSLVHSETACITFNDDVLQGTQPSRVPRNPLWPLVFTALLTAAFASVLTFVTIRWRSMQYDKSGRSHCPGFVDATPEEQGYNQLTYMKLDQGEEESAANRDQRSKRPKPERSKTELMSAG